MNLNQSLPALSAKNLLPSVPHTFKLFGPSKLFKFFKPSAAVIQHSQNVGFCTQVLTISPPSPCAQGEGWGEGRHQ
jgi:hypothetical protein